MSRRKQTNYLWQRSNTEVFWFSRAVPKHLQSIVGRRVIQKSLGTTDRRIAEALARRTAADLDETWGLLAPAQRIPSTDELDEAAVTWGFDLYTDFVARGRSDLKGVPFDEWKLHVDSDKKRSAHRAQQVVTGDVTAVAATAKRIADRKGWIIETDSDEFRHFCLQLATANLDAKQMMIAQAEGRLDATPTTPLVQNVKKRAGAKAKPGQTLMELFERYARQRVAEGLKRQDGVAQDRMVVLQFADFVGTDRSAASITKEDAREYKQAIEHIPASYAKMKAYRGLNIRQAIEKGEALNAKRLSTITQARYLSTVSPFFDWLRTADYTEVQPFDGLRINLKNKKGKNPRPPFSKGQLNTILSSPLFTGFIADGREHVQGLRQADDWRFWIPLVCLFTGARIGEVAQLRLNDVEQLHGHWFIHLRDDPKTRQKTKSGKSRSVAVHPKLQKIGFIDFCERQITRSAGNGLQLFPELGADKREQFGAMPSRFWRDYLTGIGIKVGRDGVGAHSFRHTMTDELRKAGYLDDEIGALILGHSNKTVTSGYGQVRQGTAQMLFEMITAVKFDGLNFEPLTSARGSAAFRIGSDEVMDG